MTSVHSVTLKKKLTETTKLPIRNPVKPLEFEITARDIANAKRKKNDGCAAAVAGKRQIPGCKKVVVGLANVFVHYDDHIDRYETPIRLRTEVAAYDRGGEFQPGVYTARPVTPSRRTTGQRQGSDAPGARDKGSKDRTPSRKQIRHQLENVRPRAERQG